ncbi:37S ribosomal protein S5 [Xylaria bambusicola]|uniref:37S ribosomal protein S5 n=1 Tax=Xylaria bambusicola TaxID=326684 RepID=UPI002007504C|nr:37S ribosomal protein S5 [Xylaria bambusicola]KAI0518398.1 37S ribosomal protein S5 [Xylaria bambusicola]
MSVAHPARCLLSRGLAATGSKARIAAPTSAPRCHAPFHSSAQLAKRKPRFKSVRAEEMGLVTPEKIEQFTKDTFPQYTPEELEVLRKRYTPEQMAALEAGEAAINPKDLTIQGRIRRDPYRPVYLDDFSKVLPIVDKRPKPHAPPPEKIRFMSEEEHADDLEKVIEDLIPKDVNFEGMKEEDIENVLDEKVNFDLAAAKYFEEHSTLVNHDKPSNTALAPGLGKDLRGVSGMYKASIDPEDQGLDNEGEFQDLKKKTGLTISHIKKLHFASKILVSRFVTNQTRLGKVQSHWVLAIAGNGNGRFGIGEAKSVESPVAMAKAKQLAILNMKPIPRYEDRTIFGSVEAKVGATIVKLEARPPGFGLRASHRLFEMFRIAGIRDIAAKMPRGRNPMNSVKACVKALMSQKDPSEIAIGRGKKLVDVRKVYYGGDVL